MPVPTKTYIILLASISNAAGSTKTSTTWDLTTPGKFGGLLTSRVTNGATPPTVGTIVTVNTSGNGTDWKGFQTYQAGVAANGVYDFPLEIPIGPMYVQVVFSGNTVQATTVEAQGQEATSIA